MGQRKGDNLFKGITIEHCCKISRERAQRRNLLVKLASHLKCKVDSGFLSCWEVLESVKSQIASIDLISAKGAQVRSRVQWAEEGESSSKFFFRLEKKNSSKSWIAAMRGADNVVVTDIISICSSWQSFYGDLFTASAVDLDVQRDLLNNISSFIPASEISICEGPLASDEVFAALQGMARGKTPGSDGLPAEFFWRFGMFWELTLSMSLMRLLTRVFFHRPVDLRLSPFLLRKVIGSSIRIGDLLVCLTWTISCVPAL